MPAPPSAASGSTYSPPPLPPPFNHTTPPPTLLAQGAEAHLYRTYFLTPCTPAALKIRPSKLYRHPTLDRRLTRQRILQEARCLVKLVKEGVRVPAVLAMDWEEPQAQAVQGGGSGSGSSGGGDGDGSAGAWGGAWLLMEWIEGPVVRAALERWEAWMARQKTETESGRAAEARDLMRRIGRAIGALHRAGVVHGDLTTSNLILRPGAQARPSGQGQEETCLTQGRPSLAGEVVLIDFGLASQSVQDEDRAVDLYVLERAFGSTHPHTEPFFGEVLEGYRESYRGARSALKRLEDVRLRGRKRSMIG